MLKLLFSLLILHQEHSLNTLFGIITFRRKYFCSLNLYIEESFVFVAFHTL